MYEFYRIIAAKKFTCAHCCDTVRDKKINLIPWWLLNYYN